MIPSQIHRSDDNKQDAASWALVTSPADFAALRQDWERLFFANPSHSPFLAWGWVDAWLRHKAGPHELRILCWHDAEKNLQFVLPLIVRTKLSALKRHRLVMVCSYGAEASDHLGCLRLPEYDVCTAALAAAGMEELLGAGTCIELAFSDTRGDFPANLDAISREQGRPTRLMHDSVCPAMNLPESWDEFLQPLSSNFRSQVRRHYKRIASSETLRFRKVVPAKVHSFVQTLLNLNRSRIRDKGEVSSLEDVSVRDFLADAIVYMVDHNLAWMDVIEEGGKVVGSALHFVHGKTVYYYMGGFDDSAKNLRPGTALFAHIIQRSIGEGYNRFDFLRGDDPYKYRWGATDQHTARLNIYPRGALAGKFQWALDGLELRLRGLVRRWRRPGSSGASS